VLSGNHPPFTVQTQGATIAASATGGTAAMNYQLEDYFWNHH